MKFFKFFISLFSCNGKPVVDNTVESTTYCVNESVKVLFGGKDYMGERGIIQKVKGDDIYCVRVDGCSYDVHASRLLKQQD